MFKENIIKLETGGVQGQGKGQSLIGIKVINDYFLQIATLLCTFGKNIGFEGFARVVQLVTLSHP